MEPRKYRKIPVEIDAMQWTPDVSAEEIIAWIEAEGHEAEYDYDAGGDTGPNGEDWGEFIIRTLEGNMYVSPYDYIVQGVIGEFYPVKPNVFMDTYAMSESEEEPEVFILHCYPNHWPHKGDCFRRTDTPYKKNMLRKNVQFCGTHGGVWIHAPSIQDGCDKGTPGSPCKVRVPTYTNEYISDDNDGEWHSMIGHVAPAVLITRIASENGLNPEDFDQKDEAGWQYKVAKHVEHSYATYEDIDDRNSWSWDTIESFVDQGGVWPHSWDRGFLESSEGLIPITSFTFRSL